MDRTARYQRGQRGGRYAGNCLRSASNPGPSASRNKPIHVRLLYQLSYPGHYRCYINKLYLAYFTYAYHTLEDSEKTLKRLKSDTISHPRTICHNVSEFLDSTLYTIRFSRDWGYCRVAICKTTTRFVLKNVTKLA